MTFTSGNGIMGKLCFNHCIFNVNVVQGSYGLTDALGHFRFLEKWKIVSLFSKKGDFLAI